MSIIGKTGGLSYHYSAVRFKKNWNSFLNEFTALLETITPQEELVLLAPSAGYLIPNGFLQKFNQVTCYDIDPLARLIFRSRNKNIKCNYQLKDILFKNQQLSIDPMAQIIKQHKNSFFIFCNIWGQIPLLIDKEVATQNWPLYLNQLLKILEGNKWLSFHELFSGYNSPIRSLKKLTLKQIQDPNILFAKNSGLIIDHLIAENLDFDSHRHYFEWQRLPKSYHLIETIGQNW